MKVVAQCRVKEKLQALKIQSTHESQRNITYSFGVEKLICPGKEFFTGTEDKILMDL
jgi:hypothetical protein